MKPPTFVECSVCGREFGSKSIKIHERQCLQKLRRTEIPPEQSSSTSKGTRRKKKAVTSSKSDHSTLTTVMDNSLPSSKQITLPKIQTESNYRSTDSQNRKGIIRPTTATLAKPKFLNLDHIQYDMSLTRIDYKTSTLKIMGEDEQGHRPVEELILPSVTSTSSSGNDKQTKKINIEAPTNTNAKLPQSTIATISSFFGTPLRKSTNGDGNEISLPRQSGNRISPSILFCSNYYSLDSHVSLTLALQSNDSITFPLLTHSAPSEASEYNLTMSHEPLLHTSSSTGFPVLCSHTELKRVQATHSTSLLDDGILPQISNDRSPDEPHLDTVLTSTQNFINLPSHFQDERRGQEVGGQYQPPLPSAQGANSGDELQHSSAWKTHGTAQEVGEEQMGHFDQSLSETSPKLVVLKEPASCFDFESIASTSTTEFVMEEHSVLIEQASRGFAQEILDMCASSDSEVNSVAVAPNLPKDMSRTLSTASRHWEPNVADYNAWIHGSKDENRDRNLRRKSILKKRSSEEISSRELTPGYFRDRGRLNSFTGSDCDDEDESGQYGFLRQVSSLTLIKKSDSKKQCHMQILRKKNSRNSQPSRGNLRRVADDLPDQHSRNVEDEDQLMNQLTSLLHHKLAEPKKRKCRFPRPDSVQEKVNDWLASCDSQPGVDPVSIWEGHGNTAPSQTNHDRPSSSPAAIHYVDEDEYGGYDTDISRTSTDPSMGDVNEGTKRKVISGLLSAVFRIKEMHKTRTYQFRDQMTVNDTETDSGTQDTVHIRRKKTDLQKRPLELLNPAPVPVNSKTFGHKMTSQKLDSKTLKVLETIERNAIKATTRSKPARPQTAPCLSTKRSQTKEQLPVRSLSKLVSTSSGYGPPVIIPRSVAPTQEACRTESPVMASVSEIANYSMHGPVTSPSLKREPLEPSQQVISRPDSTNIRTSQVSRNPVKPKPKRPLTPRPVMKAGANFPPQNPGKLFTKSTVNQSCQIPEKRSKLVQSSPTMGRKLNLKSSKEVDLSQAQSLAKVNRPRSPYEPPKSILKQLPKSKLVKFILNQDSDEHSKNKGVKPIKRQTLAQKPKMEANKDESFLQFLSEPFQKFNAAEYSNNGDYSITHQVYQFETETKFGKPVPSSQMIGSSGGQSHPGGMTSSDRTKHSSSSDSEEEFSSTEFENSKLQPAKTATEKTPGVSPAEQLRQNDTSYWERIAQLDDRQNAIREKELDRQDRAKKFSVERKSRFKSTYSLLVPKAVAGDRLMDLNIIVRRRDEFSDYPAIEEVIQEFSTDWMYLIVDEVKLTARSPNPYIESQAEHIRDYGEHPLKITTSSHSTLDSNVESQDENAQILLTCYICGHEMKCAQFRRHQTDCQDKFLERNQLLEPEIREYLPKTPQGTITFSIWNRFAQHCTKRKRITCPFCDISFVPTETNVAEHKISCKPLPRLTPIQIQPLLDNFGNEIEPPCSPFVDLKLESDIPGRDVEGSVAEQFRKRFNKKRQPKETKSRLRVIELHEENEPHSLNGAQHKKIVNFVEKERN